MFGPEIKRLRKRKKLTQNDLAETLGVSRQAIAMWETGKRELKATTVRKIARAFGVPVDNIIIQETQKEAGMPRTSKPKTKQKKVDFQLVAPEAKKVKLAGDFNSWDEKGITMKKTKDGVWKTGVKLDSGRYEYKFIVDNNWWLDPQNNNTTTNAFGAVNSVVEVSA